MLSMLTNHICVEKYIEVQKNRRGEEIQAILILLPSLLTNFKCMWNMICLKRSCLWQKYLLEYSVAGINELYKICTILPLLNSTGQ